MGVGVLRKYTPTPTHPNSFFFIAYVSLYRKYRSQSFGEVVGQNHVTLVLQNAIRMGRVAHAYLFCGPRGCGKTSTARLLARALNCQESDGPTAEPCGSCEMCTGIRDGSAMDVIEMDAASETGIDDVREKIIENARFAPAIGRFKVYIIDEVHDLSLKAFDSLLKTIEEPPAHVAFILATTEAHKVPITVRSRCQRLDFRRGTLADLTTNLRRVLDAEAIPYQIEAVAAVARAAEGSFRDSLSILEQVLAYTDGELTAEAVHEAIGTVGSELLDEVTSILASDDMNAAFLKAGELVDSGKDVRQTLIALQNHLRDLLVAAVAKSVSAIPEVTPERFAELKEQSSWFRPAQLLRMLDLLAEAERDIRFSNQHRLLLEKAFWSILPGALSAEPESVITSDRQSGAVSRGEKSVPRQEMEPEPQPGTAVVRAELNSDSAPRYPVVSPGDIDLAGLRNRWKQVLKRITQNSRSASALLDGVQISALEGNFIVLGFPDKFKLDEVDKPKRRDFVEKAFAEELRVSGLKVRCRLIDAPSPITEDVSNGALEFASSADEPSSNGAGHGDTVQPANSQSADEPSILKVLEAEFGDRLIQE